jgi:hypothetical protein
MSKGGSSGSTTATTSIDPDLKAAYLSNINQAQSVAGALPVRQFAGFNPLYTAGEQELVNTGLGGPGIGSVDQAAYQTGMAGAYQPQMVGGFGGGPAALSGATGYQAYNFGGAQTGPAALARSRGYRASDVTAAQANMADIGQYMNPYTQNVTRNTLADLEIGRQNAVRQISQQAGAAKAFGGSRQGVAEAQTNIGFGTEAGKLLAQLNEQAYNSAMNAQQQDLARQQQAAMQNAAQRTSASQFGAGAMNQAQLTNAAAQNAMAQFNVGNLQQAGLTNMASQNAASQFGAGAMNQAQLSNAAAQNAMAQYNANLAQQAALANQSTGLAGAQFRLGAANQLGNLGMQQQGLRMSGAQAAMQAGGARQQLEQAQMDALRNIGLEKFGVASGALSGQIPNLGMTETQPYFRNQTAGALGGAAAGYRYSGNSPYGAALGGLLGYFG